MRGRQVRLVTVTGPAGRQDVAAAADASLVYLLPVLIDLVGGDVPPPSSPRWSLYTEDGQVVARTRSLAAAGVVDGQVLVLSPTPLSMARPEVTP
jgi:hypothetical protein